MSTTSRGYGHAHQQLRAQYAQRMANGETFTCAKCTRTVAHGMDWHLGHTDDRSGYTGPEHAGCNVRDGASRGGRVIADRKRTRPLETAPQRAW